MKHILNLQNDITNIDIPDFTQIDQWVAKALQEQSTAFELTLRIVDETESAKLNAEFRHINKPTNVLAFPYDYLAEEVDTETPYLGDIAICATIVAKEAVEQKKTLAAHWAHIVIHGTLHLLDYDHIEEKDALVMESLEIELLKTFGFSNPYEEDNA